MKKESEPIIPRKRLLDHDSIDCDLEGFRKQKPRVLAVRDFPPGCGIKEVDREPLKKLRNVNSNLQNMTVENNNKLSSFKPIEFGIVKPEIGNKKPVNSQPLDHNKLSSIEVAEFNRNKPAIRSKPEAKVKFLDPIYTKECHGKQTKVTPTTVSRAKPLKNFDNVDPKVRKLTSNGAVKNFGPIFSKEGEAQKSEIITTTVSRKELTNREKIKEAMSVFDQVYNRLYQENKVKPKGEKIAHWRVPLEAAKLVKQMVNWIEPEKSLGCVSGVQIGDKFKYRSQLKMIGLHCQPQSGIDYTNIKGKNLALSIVDSHRYSNERGSSDMLVYCGQGGIVFLGQKLPPEDQKLARGNLALKNSMDEKTPIRVIRKLDVFQKNEGFVYDGLYVVNHYTHERNDEHKIMFKFHLNRVPGQPPLHQMLNAKC